MGDIIANEMTDYCEIVTELISLGQKSDFRLESDFEAIFSQTSLFDPLDEPLANINFRVTIQIVKYFHDLTLSEIRQEHLTIGGPYRKVVKFHFFLLT
jgi:hypothetical protein